MSGRSEAGVCGRESEARESVSAVSGAGRGMFAVQSSKAVLPARAGKRADGVETGERARGNGAVSGEDEDGGSAASLSQEGSDRRVSVRDTEGAIRVEEVPGIWQVESRSGGDVGMLDAQRNDLDEAVLAPTHSSW